RSAPVLIAAVGMTLVVLARHIDISVGAQFSVAGVIAGLLAKSGLPMLIAAPLTILAGAALGALNGALVAGFGLPSIVATLATFFAFQEGLRWARQGESVKGLPDDFQWFGLGQGAGEAAVLAVAAAVFVVFLWGLRHLAGGRALYAVGSDAEAARLAGIRPRRVVFAAFAGLGALVGLAALVNAARFPQVDPNAGKGLEMQVVAAVVVGGVAISGGRGSLLGVLAGVLLLLSLSSALTFLRVSAEWEKAVQGAIILVAVASDAINLRSRRHARPGLAPA
ncbi:MAG TPA: ABC transporter permease, partial [Planctomycetota bacterium]|nr:ABC transporter permease [Planctomycetota bacterium]